MNNEAPSLQEQHLRAKQMVDRFVRCFEPSYRLLLQHVALPLVLTPELVNYLRNQFLRSENVPWVAEVDLLLSDLCRQVGYEQYVLETDVRVYLLAEMQKKEFGTQRMQEIAQLLIAYFQHLSVTNPYIRPHELETQQWAAMVYLDDQRETAVRQIAQAYQNASSTGTNTSQINRAEMARLSRITKELEEQLKKEPEKYREFLEYAKLVTKLITGSSLENKALNHSYSTLGLKLPALNQLIPDSHKVADEPPLQTFEFDVATVEVKNRLLRKPQIQITRRRHQAQYFTEKLPNNFTLDMVAIPGGAFLMGAPETEKESDSSERPQHQVTVSPFFMGKYTVTQAQWRAVATLPQVNRELKPDPSYFKGDNLPVECVTWYDSVEFCDRLSKYTGKNYRLPSEAEWEYACRAGTTTPFHFGETIMPELTNYNGKYTYGSGSQGEYRGKTTPVGSFQIANNFGLFDMHGNVWEWCSDDWHENYEGAPIDSSSWIEQNSKQRENNQSLNDNLKMLRGGSWYIYPQYCRSASRFYYGNDVIGIGFRVVVGGARTL
mgnify:CR=1 FL=1